jgi:hypothetical protein
MKHNHHHNNISRDQNQKPAGASRSATMEGIDQNVIGFAPAPDEVAKRAYFSFVNEGSLPGQDVQHWLAAEAEMIAEHNLTRVRGL